MKTQRSHQRPADAAIASSEGLYSVNPLRRILFGAPIATEQSDHARLPKIVALPVFASDAISSVAYATQEVLLVLGAAGLWLTQPKLYHNLTLSITAAIVALLCIVVFSYRQTIFAYPHGGGSYSVTRENLGAFPGLIAAGALLMDYVLTVAVSIASGVQNLLATPFLAPARPHIVAVCVLCIAFIAYLNLRGLKESGAVFAVPTYSFVLFAAIMVMLGLSGHADISAVRHTLPLGAYTAQTHLPTILLISLILKAFASGCSAMTGTEAVSNGVPAFRRPESKNAATTLGAMAVILGLLFLGISSLSVRLNVVYGHTHGWTAQPVIEQLSAAVFGRNSLLYYIMVFATAGILLLAANTSFADFPRLAAILSRDRYMPRQMSNVGDKLVFSNGILLLALCAVGLIVVFKGNVDHLIPLYAVGVFTAFTLSQSAMVRRWRQLRDRGWWFKAAVNGFGAFCTGSVLVVIMAEKFLAGAWVVVVLVALLVTAFTGINRHYEWLRSRLTILDWEPESTPMRNTVLVLVPSLHRGLFAAMEYARGLAGDCRGIHIDTDAADTTRLTHEWEQRIGEEIPLVVLPSPFRSIIGPLVAYVKQVMKEREHHVVTVVVPEFVPGRWWHGFLHNSNGLLVKYYLGRVPGVVVVNVRYHLPAGPQGTPVESTQGSGRAN